MSPLYFPLFYIELHQWELRGSRKRYLLASENRGTQIAILIQLQLLRLVFKYYIFTFYVSTMTSSISTRSTAFALLCSFSSACKCIPSSPPPFRYHLIPLYFLEKFTNPHIGLALGFMCLTCVLATVRSSSFSTIKLICS